MNYFVATFLLINVFAYSQKTVYLEAYEYSRDKKAQQFISEVDFEVLSNHETLVDSTWWGSTYSFKTSEKEVNIHYKNVYGQALDTVIEIRTNNQKIGIWIDKFQDYELETFLQKSIEEKLPWQLKEKIYSEFTIYDTKIEVFESDGSYYLNYSFERQWLKKPTNISNFKVKLKEENLVIINHFEKLIRTNYIGDPRLFSGYNYTLTVGDKTLKFENTNTLGINISSLMKRLDID
ncbi:hypothetical protein AAU57_10780 [Nonlabens sp. YIK11]|uniref:hypothetical protein n=1 Tax=Nonlabens sp. YIK11 TaxID=1453349 RepID=UPI0006DC049A|nr:hypothetical protein [Nonlabens sp. YIK11]KQC33760.1 hypothetical protein AAU57_10780 [Nonlabens sp. YIK11]